MSVNSGMEAAAAKYDMDVITLAPDSELDREVQEKQVEKLIDQNVDALAVAPIDSYHVPDYLDEIEKKKITAAIDSKKELGWCRGHYYISGTPENASLAGYGPGEREMIRLMTEDYRKNISKYFEFQ